MLKSHEFYFRNRAMKDCPKKKLGKWADMAQVQKEIRGSILKGVQVEILIPNYKVNNNAYRRAIKLSLGIIENKETIPHFGRYLVTKSSEPTTTASTRASSTISV